MSPDVLQTFFRLCRLDMIGLSNYSTLIVSVILAVVVYFAYCQFGVYLASLPITLDCWIGLEQLVSSAWAVALDDGS